MKRISCHGQPVRSISDVTSAVADKSWYHEDIENSRNILYMLQYGIYHKDHNSWLISEENKWLRSNRIRYADDNRPVKDGVIPRMRKGFVYKLLSRKSSDNIIRTLQTATKNAHNEFVSVKNRPYDTKNTRKKDEDYIYSSHQVNGKTYYVVTAIKKTLMKDIKYFEDAVKTAHRDSVSREELMILVNEVYGDLSNSTELTGTKDMLIFDWVFFRMYSYVYVVGYFHISGTEDQSSDRNNIALQITDTESNTNNGKLY